MAVTKLESRPLYGIGTVARLAGIKPDTLRMWERRYGLGASQKSDTGRRQYTQTDLEHLQIISRLVGDGYRIGEIASMGRKTLEALLDKDAASPIGTASAERHRILIVGELLCDWLSDHPGVVSRLDTTLFGASLDEAFSSLSEEAQETDLLVIECPGLSQNGLQQIQRIREITKARSCMVFYQFSNQAVLSTLAQQGIGVDTLPLTTEKFAGGMKWLLGKMEAGRGSTDAGELVAAQPRLFEESELRQLAGKPMGIACGCNQHLTHIISSLVNFEDYSKTCSVENWQNAATHAVVYAYTNQARWLMEKALNAVLEEHAQHSDSRVD